MSEGCNKIIKEGAKLVDDIEDIISEYNIIDFNKNSNNSNNNLNGIQQTIFDIIKSKGSLHIDKICDYSKMNIKDINCILNILKLKE